MSSLKDALKGAGFQNSKPQNERPKAKQWEKKKKIHSHQEHRNYCEVCERTCPDVERYKHRNPVIYHAKWICTGCADKHEVHDETRETNQSDFARRGAFKRFFGPTKRFPKN